MQGKKTHEQQRRILERKDDLPPPDRSDAERQTDVIFGAAKIERRGGRQSEFPVSSGGMNQESDHNKHNDRTQPGHKPQSPEPAQEKQN